MFNDRIDSSSSTVFFDSLESLQKCIAEEPSYPSIIDDLLDDDEISFDRMEWLIKDSSTEKIRPPKLCEFLYLILDNSRYNSYASWLDESQGLFRIHKPIQVTKLWEKVKIRHTNTTMNFDKFSRGIRYYYGSGLMIRTNKKYTYRFATNK
jgi:hypothetical protein